MNVAILIGVSEYKAATPLPACAADVDDMNRLLAATKKYDEIRSITTETNADQLKNSLREFFAKYQGKTDVEEVFVYFSGHGIFQNDALLCGSDFDHNRPATTSISNEELDDLLRSVGPKVAVKVIDACQSGSPYIKDSGGGFEKALKASRLSSFICMASSRLDQSSYASEDASHFTKQWIDAALQKQTGKVLYRDIQAALADAFVSNPEQTPFFVTQGTGLELFSSVTEEMRNYYVMRTTLTERPPVPKDDFVHLISREVERLDALYVPRDSAYKAINIAGSGLVNEAITDSLVASFYEKRVLLEGKLSTLPRVKDVAEFAAEQKWSKNYFVKVPTEPYEVKVPKSVNNNWTILAALASGKRLEETEYKSETRYRPAGLSSTESLPFEVAEVAFEANGHPSLKAFTLYIGIVHSITEIMVLSAIVRLSQKGWDERSPELSDIQWRYQSHLWKDVVENPRLIWEEPIRNGQSTINAYLGELHPKKCEDLAVAPPADNPELMGPSE